MRVRSAVNPRRGSITSTSANETTLRRNRISRLSRALSSSRTATAMAEKENSAPTIHRAPRTEAVMPTRAPATAAWLLVNGHRSLDLHPRPLHYLRPAIEIGNEQLCELLGRAGRGLESLARQVLADVRQRQYRADLGGEPPHDLRRHAGRPDESVPQGRLVAGHGFRDRRGIGHGPHALGAGGRERAQPAGTQV